LQTVGGGKHGSLCALRPPRAARDARRAADEEIAALDRFLAHLGPIANRAAIPAEKRGKPNRHAFSSCRGFSPRLRRPGRLWHERRWQRNARCLDQPALERRVFHFAELAAAALVLRELAV